MLLRSQPAVALLTSDSPPETFRRLRKLAGLSLYDVARLTGAHRPVLNDFELEKHPLALPHRVKFAKVLNAAIAEKIRELHRVGALPEPSQVEQESIGT